MTTAEPFPFSDRPGRDRVAGKVALVFGAGASGPGWGNGKAAAMVYAREGARVAAIDIHREAAEATRDRLRADGHDCEAWTADVSDEASVASTVAAVLAHYGRIDILHNNVGIIRTGSLLSITEADWNQVIATNLTGSFLTCKHVFPAMLAQGGGAVINISSLASIQVNRYPYLPYFAAKAGLNQMTRALAVEYADRNIRVNAILPGVMDTPLVYQQFGALYPDRAALVAARNAASPMGRMGDAWDVAYTALFLASDEARYITGVCIPVDGGKHCAGR